VIVQVPIGVNAHGVPVGLGLLQTKWREPLLLKMASAMEDLLQVQLEPQFHNLYAQNIPVDYSLA
jgi:Asp-tRNA(Asn)/Glu-tRNA(Gln) amidotransferase A subunit family amidase